MTLFNCWIVLGIYGLAVIGVTCTRLNVALQKTVYQSKTLDYYEYKWTADLAVDNKTKFTGDGCRCCAGVGYEYPAKGPWWEIDLGAPVKVGKVKVFGRKDEAYKMLYGFKMFVSETTPYNYSTSPYVYINNVTSEEYLANQGVTDVLFGDTPIRYIALALHRPRAQNKDVLMVVCEVQVFMPCDNYHFEPDCAQCHCDGSPCNKATGLCPGGCTPGWKGQRCDQKKICASNTYSVDCVPCGHCLQGDACDIVTGFCPRGCETTHDGDHCTVPKAKVHAESVLIGVGVCLVGLVLISGIVVGIRYALQRRQSVREDHLAGESNVKGQSVYDEPAGASDMKGQSVYEQPARVSDDQDEHQYCSVVEYNAAAVSKY